MATQDEITKAIHKLDAQAAYQVAEVVLSEMIRHERLGGRFYNAALLKSANALVAAHINR